MKVMVQPLTHCDECGNNIYVDDVKKHVPIPDTAGYIAVIYKCVRCGVAGRAAIDDKTWRTAQRMSSLKRVQDETAIKEAEIMLDQEITVPYLISYWNSLKSPPPLEN